MNKNQTRISRFSGLLFELESNSSKRKSSSQTQDFKSYEHKKGSNWTKAEDLEQSGRKGPRPTQIGYGLFVQTLQLIVQEIELTAIKQLIV